MTDDRDDLWRLLSEGLDLCVRARTMDAMGRRKATLEVSRDPEGWQADGSFDRYVAGHNEHRPEAPIHTRSATVYLWMQEQYDTDLASWETRARDHLVAHPSFVVQPIPDKTALPLQSEE